MPTAKERYKAAIDYLRRAIAAVEGPPFTPNTWDAAIETYAGAVKTQPVRGDLARIDARWMRATSDAERSRIARDAELLADRTKENLPGAPQDWKRTNLYKDEREHSTPATTYQHEFNGQADQSWAWVKEKAEESASGAGHLAKWLVVGGGVLLGIKAVQYLSSREKQRNRRSVGTTRRVLDAALEEAAESSSPSRNAASTTRMRGLEKWIAKLTRDNPGYAYGFELGRVYARVWRRYGAQDSRSVVAFVDLDDGTIYRGESWKKAGRAISTLDQILLDGRRLDATRNANDGGDGAGIDKLREWMVTSTPPPDTDARYQHEWLRGYERMAKEAMAALTNRGVISSPTDVKAWREAARRRLRWDNTTGGQGALAFLDALARFPNDQRKQPATAEAKKLADQIRRRSLLVVPTKPSRKTKTTTPAREQKPPAKPKGGSKPARNSDDLAVARTIRQQLGAQTLAMLGAADFVGAADSLQFSIKGSRKTNKVRIVLAPDDTYTVEFWKGRGINMSKVASFDGVHVEALHDLIESQTGLYTRMGAR